MGTAAIRTEGLSKRFGRVVALDGLDLCVERGEIFGFLGPNGAGKSTTIRLLLHLIRPTVGAAWIMGVPVADVERAHLHVSYVPGDVSLWPQLTGLEILTYLGNLAGTVDLAFRTSSSIGCASIRACGRARTPRATGRRSRRSSRCPAPPRPPPAPPPATRPAGAAHSPSLPKDRQPAPVLVLIDLPAREPRREHLLGPLPPGSAPEPPGPPGRSARRDPTVYRTSATTPAISTPRGAPSSRPSRPPSLPSVTNQHLNSNSALPRLTAAETVGPTERPERPRFVR